MSSLRHLASPTPPLPPLISSSSLHPFLPASTPFSLNQRATSCHVRSACFPSREALPAGCGSRARTTSFTPRSTRTARCVRFRTWLLLFAPFPRSLPSLPPSFAVAPLSNDNYFDLGLRVAETISLSITQSRLRDGIFPSPSPSHHPSAFSPSLPQVSAARRPSVALSPNLSAAAGVGAVLPNGNGRRRSSAGAGLDLSAGGKSGLGIGLGQFGEGRPASVALYEEEEEGEEERPRRGSGSGRMAKKEVVKGREAEIHEEEREGDDEEEMRRSMSEGERERAAKAGGPLGQGRGETLISI